PAQVGPAQVGPAQVGPAQVGPAQVGPAQVGPAQVGPAQVGPARQSDLDREPHSDGRARIGGAVYFHGRRDIGGKALLDLEFHSSPPSSDDAARFDGV